MKTSEIIAAVENGAKWQYRGHSSNDWIQASCQDKLGPEVKSLCGTIKLGYEVRLTPQKKTVPLGPEDFTGQCWWVRGGLIQPSLVVTVAPEYVRIGGYETRSNAIYYNELIANKYERSRDGKTWEPCHKEVEE